MNYWLIIIILGAIALTVGPIMMFKPSAREQRLATLRQSAAQKGIGVRLVSEKASSSKQPLMVYSKSLPPRSSVGVEWLLLKSTLSHEVNFYQDWDWVDSTQSAPQQYQQAIRHLIRTLDGPIWGIELTHHAVGVWWNEEHLALHQIEELLDELQAIVI